VEAALCDALSTYFAASTASAAAFADLLLQLGMAGDALFQQLVDRSIAYRDPVLVEISASGR
jgi:hypothetical protein